jgi:hypothetical protein
MLLAASCAVAAGVVAGCTAAGPPVAQSSGPSTPRGTGAPIRSRPASHRTAPARQRPAPGGTVPAGGIPAIGRDPASLASQLTSAERALGQAAAPTAVVARQTLIVQLACLRVTLHPGWANTVIEQVAPAQRAAATADIKATADLVALTPPQPRLPPWRITAAQPLARLRADYRAGQAATGVGWSYLAAINFTETDFGRIAGPSTAGAQGPMQFMPATWASYGHGDINRPRPAILAAARFLLANGAARNISSALFAYNHSWEYVDAVLLDAHRILASPSALAGYYQCQIIYRLRGGWVLLPRGYGTSPAVHAIPLHP